VVSGKKVKNTRPITKKI